MKTFIHTPLHEPDRKSSIHEIRILKLYHGQPGNHIRISIMLQAVTEGLISNEQVPDEGHWEALSYTWGDESQPRRNIYVATETGAAVFVVRENLYHALEQLRLPDKDRRLWIDAICIDQSDTDEARTEKIWQLPIMHEIYSRAESTIIWLGEAGDDSDFAIDFLKELGQTFVFDHVTYEFMMNMDRATKRAIDVYNNPDRKSWSSREHRSVCALFARDWFNRVWIRQEIFAASDASVVLCGSRSLPLIDFRNAVQFLAVRGLDVRSPNHASELQSLTTTLTVCQKEYASIFNIMDRIRVGKYFMPQDKIYGCLGMIKVALGSEFVSKIPKNYPPTLELFKEFFLQYFRQYGTIRLLRDAGLCQRSLLGGPSWVPDWLTDFARLDLSMECAASHALLAEAEYIGSDVLRSRGCFATKVAHIDRLRHVKDTSSDNFGEAYAELSRLMRAHLRPDDKTQMHAFVRALCCPLTALRVPIEKLQNKMVDIERFARATMDPANSSSGLSEGLLDADSLNNFQACIRHFMQQRLPFIFTEDGQVGIGADQVQPGDLIAAILGSTNLFILRTLPDDARSQYHLVGSCFMHGYNWGEALLGPLPDGITVVPRLNPDRGVYLPYYVNKSTGEAEFWDPRIDWSVLTPEPGEAAYMINAPRGEPSRKVPTAAYFERYHGVHVQDIDLV